MSNNIKEFLQKLTGPGITNLERAIGVIWWQSRSDTTQSMDVSSIARILHCQAPEFRSTFRVINFHIFV